MPDPTPTDFRLSDQERQSPLWRRLETHFNDRLNGARVRNDHPCPDIVTASTRGEIKLLKALINLGKPGQPTGE